MAPKHSSTSSIALNMQLEAKDSNCKLKRDLCKQTADSVKQSLSYSLKHLVGLAQEEELNSTWLTMSRIWFHTAQEGLLWIFAN